MWSLSLYVEKWHSLYIKFWYIIWAATVDKVWVSFGTQNLWVTNSFRILLALEVPWNNADVHFWKENPSQHRILGLVVEGGGESNDIFKLILLGVNSFFIGNNCGIFRARSEEISLKLIGRVSVTTNMLPWSVCMKFHRGGVGEGWGGIIVVFRRRQNYFMR